VVVSIRDSLLALLLTEIVEVTVALILGYRRPREIVAVILVNLVTNPSLNYLLSLNNHFGIIRHRLPLILFSELGVVLIEWILLVFALRRNKKSLLILSFTMNACSYLTGVLIFGW